MRIMDTTPQQDTQQTSDDESLQFRLSCILEDDESECSANGLGIKQKKTPQRSDDFSSETVRPMEEKTEDKQRTDDKTEQPDISRQNSEEEEHQQFGFAIKKLKSSDKLFERPVVVKRVDYSSDSSDLDTSQEPSSSDKKAVEVSWEDDTLSITPENVFVEFETSGDEKEQTVIKTVTIEAGDAKGSLKTNNESLPCLGELTKDMQEEDEEKEEDPSLPDLVAIDEELNKAVSFRSLESIQSSDTKPPVPPETYMWEDLKRLKQRGGYPWTYLEKPPFDEETWKKLRDHEYEPINPPPQNEVVPGTERPMLRIPLDRELVVQSSIDEEEDAAMAEEPRSPEDLEVERIAAAQDLQDSVEARYLGTTPTTTASRTDCDVNTSMLDSSGLEDLPLNRGSRVKKASLSKTEQMRAQAHGIHQKLRSQAGKLRSKLRSLPKPSFSLKDKEKEKDKPSSEGVEKSRFKLPDRSKFKLPERPKFTLPERPKFTLPERPKFNLPQRPKINLPSFGKSRTLRDRQQSTGSTVGSRKNVFEFDFKTYPKMFNKKSKQRGDYTTSSPKQTRGNTPPPKMRYDNSKKTPVEQTWSRKLDEIQYADADPSVDRRGASRDRESARSEGSESLSDFRDKELGYTEDLEVTRLPPGRRTISTKSSMSHLSEREMQSSGSSEDRHRKGVLEEIDSDEFFLRQKGISQDDIDMGKYLSEEIREAFRSSVVNALTQLDGDYDEIQVENVPPQQEPNRPSRTRSLRKRSTVSKVSEDGVVNEEDRFKTYPPQRPSRKSRSQSKSNVNEEVERETPKHRYENSPEVVEQNSRCDETPQVLSRYDNVPQVGGSSDHYKVPGPATEYQHYKVPRAVQPTPIKRKSSAKDKGKPKKRNNDEWVEVAIETSFEEMVNAAPQPLSRKKSKRSLNETGDTTAHEEAQQTEKVEPEPDYIIPTAAPQELDEETPLPPKRTRSLSRGKSMRSLGVQEEQQQKTEEKAEAIPLNTQPAENHTTVPLIHHYEVTGDDDMSVGYATIGKPSTLGRPERTKKLKPPRPPPPRRRRVTPSPTFNTLPSTRTPQRPVRNYSTLGPSRPPRRPLKSAVSLEHMYADDVESVAYAQLNSDTAVDNAATTAAVTVLQTEQVIEKMKVRPLPAPPRPPRQKGRGSADEWQDELTEEDKISIAVLRGEVYPLEHETRRQPTSQDSVEVIEEVCVSTQTDPLPEDYCVEGEEELDIINEFSHEQLQIQEAFLEEMKKEEERIQREMELKRRNKAEGQDELKITSQVIKQIDEILAEEKRLLVERQKVEEEKQAEEYCKKMLDEAERRETEKKQREEEESKRKLAERREAEKIQREDEESKRKLAEEIRRAEELRLVAEARRRQEAEEAVKKQKMAELQVADADMGYASLDRRQARAETAESHGAIPKTPSRQQHQQPAVDVPAVRELQTERLQIQELDVGRLNVGQLHANSISVNNLSGQRLNIEDIQSRAGNLVLGNIELPPGFIDQILARIPWEEFRPHSIPQAPTPASTPVDTIVPVFPAPSRTLRRIQLEESDEEGAEQPTPRRPHRRVRQPVHYSSDDDEPDNRLSRRYPRQAPTITELSQQLSRACTSAGIRVMRDFGARVRPCLEGGATQYTKTGLCILLVLFAAFFLLTFDSKSVHHYHWDFQFPPQPPPTPPPE